MGMVDSRRLFSRGLLLPDIISKKNSPYRIFVIEAIDVYHFIGNTLVRLMNAGHGLLPPNHHRISGEHAPVRQCILSCATNFYTINE